MNLTRFQKSEINALVEFYFYEMGLDSHGDVTNKIKDKDKTLRALEATKKILSKQQLNEDEIIRLKYDNSWNGGVEEIQKITQKPLNLRAGVVEPIQLKKYLLELTNEKIDLIKSLQKKPTPDQKYDLFLKDNKQKLDQSFAFFKKDYDSLYNKANTEPVDTIRYFATSKNPASKPTQPQIKDEAKLRQEFDKRVKEFVTTPSKPNQVFIWEPKNDNDPIDLSFNIVSTSTSNGGPLFRVAREAFFKESTIQETQSRNSNYPSVPSSDKFTPSPDAEKFNPQTIIGDSFKKISNIFIPFSQSPKIDIVSSRDSFSSTRLSNNKQTFLTDLPTSIGNFSKKVSDSFSTIKLPPLFWLNQESSNSAPHTTVKINTKEVKPLPSPQQKPQSTKDVAYFGSNPILDRKYNGKIREIIEKRRREEQGGERPSKKS